MLVVEPKLTSTLLTVVAAAPLFATTVRRIPIDELKEATSLIYAIMTMIANTQR